MKYLKFSSLLIGPLFLLYGANAAASYTNAFCKGNPEIKYICCSSSNSNTQKPERSLYWYGGSYKNQDCRQWGLQPSNQCTQSTKPIYGATGQTNDLFGQCSTYVTAQKTVAVAQEDPDTYTVCFNKNNCICSSIAAGYATNTNASDPANPCNKTHQ